MLPCSRAFARCNHYNSRRARSTSSSSVVRGVSNTIVHTGKTARRGLSLQSTAIARQEKEIRLVPFIPFVRSHLVHPREKIQGAFGHLQEHTPMHCSLNIAEMSLSVSLLNSWSHDSKRLGHLEGGAALTMGPFGDNGGGAQDFMEPGCKARGKRGAAFLLLYREIVGG